MVLSCDPKTKDEVTSYIRGEVEWRVKATAYLSDTGKRKYKDGTVREWNHSIKRVQENGLTLSQLLPVVKPSQKKTKKGGKTSKVGWKPTESGIQEDTPSEPSATRDKEF